MAQSVGPGSRHDTAEKHIAEIDARRADIRAPKDGAVLYTNSGADRTLMPQYLAENPHCTTLEQTKLGKDIDAQQLMDNSNPKTHAMNEAEVSRLKGKGVAPFDKERCGAGRVWDHMSKSYAEEASGKVTVLTHGQPIKEHSFFARNEREILIKNEKVTHINGIERKELLKHQQAMMRETSPGKRQMMLTSLNEKIEKGDPTRTKGTPAPSEPAKNSAWERHKKPNPASPDMSKNKTK